MDSIKRRYREYLQPNGNGKPRKITRYMRKVSNSPVLKIQVFIVLFYFQKKLANRAQAVTLDYSSIVDNYENDVELSDDEYHNNIESENEEHIDEEVRIENDSESDNHSRYEIESDSDSDNIEEENENLFNGQKLHPNLKITMEDCMNMILIYFLRHNLTWIALENLILMLNTILEVAKIPSNKYGFLKHFKNIYKSYLHYYCGSCKVYFGVNIPQNLKCYNCEVEIKKKDMMFFIYIPLEQQIKDVLKKNKMDFIENWEPQRNNINDVFDGKVFGKMATTVKSNEKLVTLTINTDGVAVFKSRRKSSLWPLQMFINELSAKIRFKSENMIMTGIWYGAEPVVSVFLRPFIEEMRNIYESGILWIMDAVKIKISLRVLLCTLDTCAKCLLQNKVKFNGKYGCSYCFHPGQRTNTKDNIYRYPVMHEIEVRTNENTKPIMMEAKSKEKNVFGFKGVSPLLALPNFDVIKQVPIDYMHCVLLGVVKLLLSLWLESKYHKNDFYLHGIKVKKINSNIENIRPPNCFSRRPRPITEYIHWKANELRNWLLFYGLPCLASILPEKYLQHFALLADAIYILLKTEITNEEFQHASRNLEKFVIDFEKLYSKNKMLYNVHLLKHLADTVKESGPLWAYSNFNFEDHNVATSSDYN